MLLYYLLIPHHCVDVFKYLQCLHVLYTYVHLTVYGIDIVHMSMLHVKCASVNVTLLRIHVLTRWTRGIIQHHQQHGQHVDWTSLAARHTSDAYQEDAIRCDNIWHLRHSGRREG